eukprot:Tamp_15194.p1 GENE.Tamp_15194~~Tamp_15194.p1  ORF type:complete len:317 (+),score=61.99 Tamp_15194:25-951(+)
MAVPFPGSPTSEEDFQGRLGVDGERNSSALNACKKLDLRRLPAPLTESSVRKALGEVSDGSAQMLTSCVDCFWRKRMSAEDMLEMFKSVKSQSKTLHALFDEGCDEAWTPHDDRSLLMGISAGVLHAPDGGEEASADDFAELMAMSDRRAPAKPAPEPEPQPVLPSVSDDEAWVLRRTNDKAGVAGTVSRANDASSSSSTQSPAHHADFVEVLCEQAKHLHTERCRHPSPQERSERIHWNITAHCAAVCVVAVMVLLLLLAASFVCDGGRYSFPWRAAVIGSVLLLADADDFMPDYNQLKDASKILGF